MRGHRSVRSIAISSDGQTIASGDDDDGTVRLWNRQGQSINHPLVHEQTVNSVAISANGQKIATMSADGFIKLWNRQGKMLVRYFPGFSNTGLVWIGPGGRPLRLETGSVAISADGMTIASANQDSTVRLWNYQKQMLTQPLQIKSNDISSLAISGNGESTVIGSEDGTVSLWNKKNQSFSPAIQKHKGEVYSIAISADGQTVVSMATDGTMKVWNRQGQSLTQIFQAQTEELIDAAVSTDGQSLISGSEKGILVLWSRQDQSFKQIFKVQIDEITSVAISGNGQTIVSGQKNCTLRVWNQQGKEISQPLQELRLEGLKGVGGLDFLDVSCNTQSTISADGKIIVGATGNKLGIWDRQSKLKSLLKFSPLDLNGISAIAISADGQTIATGHSRGMIRLWTPEGKALTAPFHIYDSGIKVLAMAATRKNIVSVDYEGNIQFLPAEWKGLLQATCDKLRDFPRLKEPEDDVGKEAKKTCDYAWNDR